MPGQIIICCQKAIDRTDEKAILAAITRSNFHTLCDQYGLDHELVAPAISNLRVSLFNGKLSPYLLVHYQPKGKPPLIVHCLSELDGVGWFLDLLDGIEEVSLREALRKTHVVISIPLSSSQILDMGLLLAYEVARWVAELGNGFVQGLDGGWYRLNQYGAFLLYPNLAD